LHSEIKTIERIQILTQFRPTPTILLRHILLRNPTPGKFKILF
jgi:excinuclease UvrABC helicase subunit UvrB